jgi:hypothetical protein
MPGGLGILGYIGLAPESSGGVAVSPTVFIQALSEGVEGSFDRYELYNIIGRLAPADDRAGVMRVEGDIVAPFNPIWGGHIAKNAFGAGSVSTLGAGLFRHSWKSPAASFWDSRYALPPYTYEIFRDVGSAQQYDGCQTNELELSLGPNAVLQARQALIATSWRNKAAVTPSFSIVDPFDFDSCSFSVGGVANADIEQFSITFNNQLEGIPTLSLRDTVYKIRRSGAPTMEFSMTIGFEDITQLEAFRAQSETSLSFNVTAPNSYATRFDLPRIVYTAFPTGMGGGGRQMAEITGVARFHQASGTAFELAMTTTVGSY